MSGALFHSCTVCGAVCKPGVEAWTQRCAKHPAPPTDAPSPRVKQHPDKPAA